VSGTGPLASDLVRALPPGSVSTASADRLAASIDLWPRHILRLWAGRMPSLPLAVAWPESVEDVQTLVAFAREHALALVPYGAGSSVVGGATADEGTIVVDTKRLSRFLELDGVAGTATAQAGIMGELFERALERQGFTQGHFPSSIYCSTLGGWIAARGAGQMSSRYGKIEDQVLGGLVVLGDGTLVRQAVSPVRASLFDALIGAEGSLGLWVEATVRIQPLPAQRSFRGLEFRALADALAAAAAWLDAGLCPAVVRIYDPVDSLLHRDTTSHGEPHDHGPSRTAWLGAHFPQLSGAVLDAVGGRCRAVVMLQGEAQDVGRDEEILLSITRAHRGRDLGPGPGEAWWRTRYRVSYRQSNAFRAGVVVDTMEVGCLWERVLPVYQAVRRAARAAGAQVLAHFSHVYLEGASIYFTYALPAALGEGGYDRLWEGCLVAALEHGANVSHHHGLGRLKGAAFRRVAGGALALVRAQAETLDPAHVLNPAVLASRTSPGGPPGGHKPRLRLPRWQASEQALLATAAPSESVAALETRLLARGLTLGSAGQYAASLTVVEAARRGLLWRKSSQLRLLEPLVMGVDGAAAGEAFRYVPAPRAAMGSELWRALLDAELERVYLRCLHAGGRALWLAAPAAKCIDVVRHLARHEDLGAVASSLRVREGGAVLRFDVPPGPLAQARERALMALGAAAEPVAHDHDPLAVSAELAVVASGTWLRLTDALAALLALGVEVSVPLSDAAGGLALITGTPRAPLTQQARAGVEAVVNEAKLSLEHEQPQRLVTEEPEPRAALEVAKPERTAGSAAMLPSRLKLAPHAHELDNCTYCPKLCRFSCPVAVADGSETLTPRQLMLTASLDRRGARPLDADAALRLYSCVDCRGCRSFCDHGNDVAATLMAARAEIYRAGETPDRVLTLCRTLSRTGAFPSSGDISRPALAGASELSEGAGPSAPTWLFFGCQNEASDAPLRAPTLRLASGRFGPVHVPALSLSCCGHPLWRWGDREGFAQHARAFAAQLGGAQRLVVDDPGCAYALRELYPTVGVRVPEIVTVSSLIGAGEVSTSDAAHCAPHDDEWATRWLGEPTLRERLGVPLARGSVLEGEAGTCGGMLLAHYEQALAERLTRACVHDLLGGGAERILTASPTCRRRLRSVAAPLIDVVELWNRKTRI
jgi:alkyldihydroxyacetonephosphate synthase